MPNKIPLYQKVPILTKKYQFVPKGYPGVHTSITSYNNNTKKNIKKKLEQKLIKNTHLDQKIFKQVNFINQLFSQKEIRRTINPKKYALKSAFSY